MLRRPRSSRALAATAICAAAALCAPATASATPGSGRGEVVERAVSFSVVNTNGTDIPGAGDGRTYTVRGHITGTARDLADPDAVTLLLHGLGYGEFFGNYEAQKGYDFAAKQARLGNVTVTVDRLGYDSSDHPVGTDISFGARATIAHQIVTQLRSGEYTAEGGAPRFEDVVLAGHSVGGIIAQAEAYTYGDVDAVAVLSYSDTVVSPLAQQALATAVERCTTGNAQRAEGPAGPGTGPAGYVSFGADTAEQFIAAHFNTAAADPAVVATTAAMRNLDPCGDITSYQDAVAVNLARVDEIDVPVLVMTGGADAIYPVPADVQAGLFTGSDDVTAVTVPETGHALVLHHTRHQVSHEIDAWLDEHGFSSSRSRARR